MTQEEKAKAYDDALERAKRIKDGKGNWRFSDLSEIVPAITEIFPVLAEREDERIRKRLINLIRELASTKSPILTSGYFVDGQDEKYIAYLEKQKDQKPAEWSEEDEKMLANTLDSLRRYQLSMPNFQVELQMRWLKSLRSRPKSLDNLPKWKKASAGTKLSTDAVILYEGDPDPRIGKCAINDCIYIPITDLLTLDKDV